MDRLTHTPELLDGQLDDHEALVGNLRDLRRVNRWLGGVDLSWGALEVLMPQVAQMTLLDVGTGAADIPLALIERWGAAGRRLQVVGVDSRPEVLEAAVMIEPRLAATPGLELRVADGRALPFPDRSFDVVHASLVAHHLEPNDVRALLREMGRVARIGVIVNDLARGRLAHAGAWVLAHTLTRNALTRHDAPLSVRRAYSLDEASGFLDGLRVVHRAHGPFRHRWVVAAVPAGPEAPP